LKADTVVGSIETTYSKQAAGYNKQAKELRLRAQGYGEPFVGGQSKSQKRALREDSDRVQPIFRRRQFQQQHSRDDGTFPSRVPAEED
jgi:hypothetical protein